MPLHQILARPPESFQSVRLECEGTSDGALLERAWRRSIPDLEERLAEGSIALLTASDTHTVDSPDTDTVGVPDTRYQWRVWWRRPGVWRDDIEWSFEAAVVNIVRPDSALAYVPSLGVLTTSAPPRTLAERLRALIPRHRRPLVPTLPERLEQFPLLQPASFLRQGWRLTPGDTVDTPHGTALHVKAEYVADPTTAAQPLPWFGVNRYELLVHRERGIVLRLAGLVDGQEAALLEIHSISFDTSIPDHVFTFTPPSGTRIVRARVHTSRWNSTFA